MTMEELLLYMTLYVEAQAGTEKSAATLAAAGAEAF